MSTNVVNKNSTKQLARVTTVTCGCEIQKIKGEKGSIKVENSQEYKDTLKNLGVHIELNAGNHIIVREDSGAQARINSQNGALMYEDFKDDKKAEEIAEKFKKAIEQIGLKVIDEMVQDKGKIDFGKGIDPEQVKKVVERYNKEKAQQQEQGEGR